jgi:hypothetical protein
VSGPLLDGQGPVRTHGSIAPDRPACSGATRVAAVRKKCHVPLLPHRLGHPGSFHLRHRAAAHRAYQSGAEQHDEHR